MVLPQPIPGKGEVLTSVSNFWMARFADAVPNHLVNRPLEEVLPATDAARCRSRR